jgi:hypothetical protein
MYTLCVFSLVSSPKMNAERNSSPVDPSQPIALVMDCLEYSFIFAYWVKSELLIGPIFSGAYTLKSIPDRIKNQCFPKDQEFLIYPN